MANTGSSLSAVKAALVTSLTSVLPAANVSYQAPISGTDLAGSTGVLDAVWFGDAQGEYDNRVFCALPLRFEEVYTVTLVIQSLRPSTDGTQQVVDAAVESMLGLVLKTVADDPTLGISSFEYLYVLPQGWRQPGGFLPTGGGHGARRELDLAVTCRHSYT